MFNLGDESKVTCNYCGKTISRGKAGALPKMMSNSSMFSHLASKHADANTARAKREQDKKEVKTAQEERIKARDETALAKISIYSLKTQSKRKEFLDMVRLNPSLTHHHTVSYHIYQFKIIVLILLSSGLAGD